MTWRLNEVTDVDCVLDDSGVYAVINRVVEHTSHKGINGDIIRVRLDLMRLDLTDADPDAPIMSWIGSANAVRKAVIQYLDGHRCISREHASYIGYELRRAEASENYVQD